nr:pif-2 [Apis mellifera nudivirus]
MTICVLTVLYLFLHFTFNSKAILGDEEKLMQKLRSGPLQSLLNGSGINNIPSLNIITTNAALARANKCASGPVLIGPTGTDHDCIITCANSSARAIHVQPGERYIYDNGVLEEGTHCSIGPRPECDMKTSIAMMTINSVVCRSKFPNIVGGPLGTTIVACNNRQINDPQNYLWDYKTNTKFDPMTTTITDENELLSNGAYRFRCKFNGFDARGNRYQEHPHNRFHPISNYCASLIYRAHPNVRTVMANQNGDFYCDCGDENETRVKLIYPNDRSSRCSNVSRTIRNAERALKYITVPYNCFTLFSTIEDVGRLPPCPNEQLTREGSRMSSVEVPYAESENDLIEHPRYANMSNAGSHIPINWVLE